MNLKVKESGLCLALAMMTLNVFAGIHDEPDGVSINIADDGSYKVISIGTGTYDFNDPDDILDARKEAERNAKAAIAKFFNESLATEESATAQMSKVKKMDSDGKTSTTSVSKNSAKETLSAIRSSSKKLLTGVVVLEDEKVPSGNGGTYRVMVGVSSTTIGAATTLSNGMTESQAAQGAPASASTAEAAASAALESAGGAGVTGAAPAAGLPPVPEGWIVCVGMGSERKDVVQAALVEGISQVYGQLLQNDERQLERMKKFKMNANIMGKEMSAVSKTSSKETQSSTLTKTAGFVREYRVIQVLPKDGNQEATVYAYIVNPRAGGTVALMVCKPTMTIEDRSTLYQLGPKTRMSGAEVAKAIQFALPNGLAKANKFLILNDNSLKSVIENKATTEAMVATGLAGAQELMQAGQGLTPDFSLRTEIKDIKYSKKLGQDKKTKKFGQVYKMSIKIDVTLMNDRTGQAVKSDTITLVLDNDEIKGILAEDEEADLLQAALSKLSDPIEEWIKGN